MAEGLLRHMYGDRFDVESAGVEASEVHPLAMEVMKEAGVEISKQRSKSVGELSGKTFDVVVTLCENAKTACPIFPGGATRLIHQGFEDPAAFAGAEVDKLAVFRVSRDEIALWIKNTFAAHEE
jgi:arsenate reductase (thioredoxin)